MMLKFDEKFTRVESFIENKRQPDFQNILKVLNRQKLDRLTLFEYFMNEDIYNHLSRACIYDAKDPDLSAEKSCRRLSDSRLRFCNNCWFRVF
jgi:hypothetical protein